jgi:D-alanyl-D-alanine carboxypeptidase
MTTAASSARFDSAISGKRSPSCRAAEKLSIDDTLGKWLPEYPAWKDVTIRRLLNMTSGIPNYSETRWMSEAWANERMRAFTLKELADAAYPSPTNHLPVTKGYHYSNTNYILAAMIAEFDPDPPGHASVGIVPP